MNRDPYISLAQQALKEYLEGKDPFKEVEIFSHRKSGVFVTIKKDNQLRGYSGSIEAKTDNICHETIYNALRAGFFDLNHDPIQENELENIQFTIDIVLNIKDIDSLDELDTKQFGTVITDGWRKCVRLPSPIMNTQDIIQEMTQKANIDNQKTALIFQFEIEHHE